LTAERGVKKRYMTSREKCENHLANGKPTSNREGQRCKSNTVEIDSGEKYGRDGESEMVAELLVANEALAR